MLRSLALLLPLAFLLGCPVTGNNFPTQYANEYCAALYLCVEDPNDIEFWTQFDDEDECAEEIENGLLDSGRYEQYEEGDREFDQDAADSCLEEIRQVRDDNDCGSMGYIEFNLDAEADFCPEAYPAPE